MKKKIKKTEEIKIKNTKRKINKKEKLKSKWRNCILNFQYITGSRSTVPQYSITAIIDNWNFIVVLQPKGWIVTIRYMHTLYNTIRCNKNATQNVR